MERRRLRWDLDQPTEDHETVIVLWTDGPRDRADALLLRETDRRRGRREHVFQTLTEALNCAINTLAYPKAALFGFCMAWVAYNGLAVVRAALRSEHGREEVEAKISNDYRANEGSTTYAGMMIAGPPSEWKRFQKLSTGEMTDFLREVASQVWLAKYPRSVRGPTKPQPQKTSGRKNHHVATARLLDKQVQQK